MTIPIPIDDDSDNSSIRSNAEEVASASSTPESEDAEHDEKAEEFKLLGGAVADEFAQGGHEIKTTPILTREAYTEGGLQDDIPQYGVLGKVLDVQSKGDRIPSYDDGRLYLNTNAPLSTIVCGVQGSGKSHTVSVMLESMFVPNIPATGELINPLSGLVLHFGETGEAARPCEAAHVGISDLPGVPVQVPSVCVYVSPSSIKRMKKLYAPLGRYITVKELFFAESELDAAAFMSMMAISSSDSAPLYMQTVMGILRNLGEDYSYAAFMKILDGKKSTMSLIQQDMLQQRMELLETFLEPRSSTRMAPSPRFKKGQITIIDLSDPFIDAPKACALFEIVLRLFQRAKVDTGKVLVVDEAHKYLSQTRTSSGLTNALLTLIRQQRHMSMRVIISTQEPTIIPPVFIDLCSVVILHRFSSSAWWDHLGKHVSSDLSGDDTFDKVVQLKTGEAIVLAPSGLCIFQTATVKGQDIDGDNKPKRGLGQFGRRFILVRTRKRITHDGGASLLAVE